MTKPGIRWWPLVVVDLLAAGALVFVWTRGEWIRQYKITATILIVGLAVLAGLLWAVTVSRLAWRTRLGIVAIFVLGVGVGAASLEVKGVSGDFLPILGWRGGGEGAAAVDGSGRPEALSSHRDFPGYLGRDRDGIVDGVELVGDWELQPPRELWRRPIGLGWAGFAVAGDIAVTLEQVGDEERILALDRHTGEPYWSHAYPARFDSTIGGVGPRSVPTVDGDRLFTFGATGVLTALDLATGELIWHRSVVEENQGNQPEWGRSGSPLVVGDLVVVSAGGSAGRSLVAYDRNDGSPVWTGGDDGSSYSSPTLVELVGRPMIVIVNQASVAGHDPENGELLWSHPWPRQQPNVAVPVVIGDSDLIVSSGYGVGAKRLRLGVGVDGDLEVTEVWSSTRLKSKFANLVEKDGAVYGLDDGVLVCLDPETGERCWKRGRYGHGQLLLVGDLLLVQTERGDLVLVEATPESARELATFEVFGDKTWNPPAMVGSTLILRNHEVAVALELPAR